MPLTGEYEPSPSDFAAGQVATIERSGGTEGTLNQGKPVVVLTTVGAKSGKLRKSPLMRVEHDGEYAVVASLGGAPKNPVWYFNVIANPHVELQDGPDKQDYQAREVHGADYDTWFERAAEVWPDYREYAKKTTRKMPIFVLSPLA
jgi:deazaflavin-dependent oxidoreductase (nitroreductase family)